MKDTPLTIIQRAFGRAGDLEHENYCPIPALAAAIKKAKGQQ